ncbi:hybrid sensor histidine kinase/response regulator [Alloalcanivorax marinus]|uniref:hybrid sensor histidine kinase/response regulator n=1 Tax=Alloalcanivorax marinus TaxID=1177169 RepID=UPI001933627C|nr:ATP-binding protein [Alloalcanivorax marinus]MBL7250593.1 response regulator [Alloalcanivorax marinus]
MHRKARYWLERVVGEGDRHGAVTLQLVLLILGVLIPFCWLLRLLGGGPLGELERFYLVIHGWVAGFAWLGFLLIRRGRFRFAARLFLAGSLAMIMLVYLLSGIRSPGPAQIAHVFPLALAGVLFGRRALWGVLVFTWLCVLVGVGHELYVGTAPGLALEIAAGLMVSFLVVAVVFDGSLTSLATSLDDVETRRRELEAARRSLKAEKEEREQTMEQLVHVQKVKAIGQLAGGVAHDFNNILGVILGYAQWRERRREPAELLEALAGVETAARRGAAISRKLLNFSRQDVAHPEVFDVCEALRGLEGMLRQLFDPRVRIELLLPEEVLPVRIDRGQFELAVLNVATNARDAMPEGGHFRLAVGRQEQDASRVEIDLSDTGVGMDENVRRRIFEPFFTTKGQSSGTGLGLAVVGRVINEAGGAIEVQSRPGAGSRFRLLLPHRELAAPPGGVHSPLVLLVDDDDELRAMLGATLENGGCRVLGARDGEEAWRVIGRGRIPDVLVTDLRMPGLGGPALIRRLRPLYPELAIILISDYLPEAGALARELPPDVERLVKPFSPHLLLQYVFMLTTWTLEEGKEGEGG